jgi:hypothetical protein
MQAKDSVSIAYSLKVFADLRLITIQKQEIAFTKKSLKEAAELLYEDYENDKNLTEFTKLDGENFYEAN